MKVFVFSVPHTGTRFVTDMLRAVGVEVQQVHFNGNYQPIMWEGDRIAIVPRRDKTDTIDSWTRRKRSDPPFDKTWQEMEEFVEEFEPYQVHIDDPYKRIADVKALEELIGQPLNPDFSIKVGHFEG
jgi:hypothetical protein